MKESAFLLCLFVLGVSFLVSNTSAWEIPFLMGAKEADSGNDMVKGVLKRGISGGGVCANDADCNNNGQCVNFTCVCQPAYADPNCGYSRKSRLTAFLLAFFVGAYGAMRFYLEYTGDGVGKILLFVFGIVFICLGICCGGIVGGGLGAVTKGAGSVVGIVVLCCFMWVGIACLVANWIWWLVDWILILEKEINDNNGYELEDDF